MAMLKNSIIISLAKMVKATPTRRQPIPTKAVKSIFRLRGAGKLVHLSLILTHLQR